MRRWLWGLGVFALLAILPLTGRRFWPSRLSELLALGMVQSAALFTFSTWAIYHGHAGRVAFLTYTMPFFTLLMAWPILGERVKGLQWLAIAFAASGLIAIVQPWNHDNTPLSNALAIAAGACWGLGAIMVKRLQNRAPMDLISMTAWQMLFGLCGVAVVLSTILMLPCLGACLIAEDKVAGRGGLAGYGGLLVLILLVLSGMAGAPAEFVMLMIAYYCALVGVPLLAVAGALSVVREAGFRLVRRRRDPIGQDSTGTLGCPFAPAGSEGADSEGDPFAK